MPIPEDPADAARRRMDERMRNLTPRQRASLLGPDQQAEAGRIFDEERNRSRGRGNRQTTSAPQENLPTVRRENLPAIQSGGAGGGGGGGGSRAVVPDGNRPPVPGGGPGRALATVDRRIPLNFGQAASTAANAGRGLLTRGLGVVGQLADPNQAGRGSSLTSNPEGAAAVERQAAERAARLTMSDPNYAETADAAAATLRARTQARQNNRPTSRMSPRSSPRELTPDELHNIESLTRDPESGIAEMRGVRGEAARNIIARRAELEREPSEGMKRGGPVKKMAKGGVVSSSASSRSDGCVTKGRTKGRMV